MSRRQSLAGALWLGTLLALAGCSGPPANTASSPAAGVQPEGASGYSDKPGWAARTYAVAAANPIAAEAGAEILKRGGSAIDAAVAVQMVLGLVEPQSSGIGGGAFLLHHDGDRIEAYDGRETAPSGARESWFLQPDGKPMPFAEAVLDGRSVGVPGAVRMLEMAHRKHGVLPWAALFEPAIALAERGFPMGERLARLVAGDLNLKHDPVAAAYFFRADGSPHAAGDILRNPSYAAVLRKIAAQGSRGLHEGDVAQAIAARVQAASGRPGALTAADIGSYRARVRAPLCWDYHVSRGRLLRICGMPPPSSGALAIAQILGMLARTEASDLPLESAGAARLQPGVSGAQTVPGAKWLHYYAEASRLAFADRALYVGDPQFVTPPTGGWQALVEPRYLAQRARLVGPRRAEQVLPGRPDDTRPRYAAMQDQPEHGTSHFSVVDARGNSLAMTTSIESRFGSRLMVNPTPALTGGFLLNNELTDFSFLPTDADGQRVANRVQPGKRPRSSMAPTLVFDKSSGRVLMSGGSAGGAFIIHSTARLLYGTLDRGLDVQRAINLPNFGSVGGPLLLERGRFPPQTLTSLRALGHDVREADLTSGLHAIERTPGGWFGGADPRREGTMRGD